MKCRSFMRSAFTLHAEMSVFICTGTILMVGWLVGWLDLWHINFCRLFKAKSILC